MHSAVELRNLSVKPKIYDISLKILSQYYEMFLYPFIYNYHIKTKNGDKDIQHRIVHCVRSVAEKYVKSL